MDTAWMKEQYEERKRRVLALLSDSKDYYAEKGLQDQAKSFETLHQHLNEGLFSIVVVGEFSAGKSTFLNALMGDKYLPSFTSETTATVNFLRHKDAGPQGCGSAVYYSDPIREPLYSDSSATTIERFVSTKSDLHVVSEIDRVELFLDSGFLQDGVMLIDSPGLNGVAEGHKEVTERQIEKSHACIFMFSAEQPGRQTDFEFLTHLRSKVDTIILVLNKIDVIKKNEQSVEDVVQNLKLNYHKFFPDQPLPEIWPVAAYPGLVARSGQPLSYRGKETHLQEEKDHYLTISRMEDFEQRLWRFLVQGEKTRQQLYAPVDRVKKLLAARQLELNGLREDLLSSKDSGGIVLELAALEEEIRGIEENLAEKKQDLFDEINRIVKETREHLKSSTYLMKQKLMSDVNEWTDLNNVQQDVEQFNSKMQKQYLQLTQKIHQSFLDEFAEMLQRGYQQYQQQIEAGITEKYEGMEFQLSGGLDANSFDFHFGLDEYRNRQDSYEQELDKLEQQMNTIVGERIQNDWLRTQKNELEEKLENLKLREQTYLASFGSRPIVDRIADEWVEEKRRGGMLGWVADAFVGKKQVTRTDYIVDDSARREYDERMAKKEQEFEAEAEQIKLQQQAIPDATKSPEHYRQAMSQLEKLNLKKRQEMEQFQHEFKEKFQKKYSAALRKVKGEIEDFIDSMEAEAEEVFVKQLRNRRNQLCDIAIDAIQSNLQQLIAEKQESLEIRKQQLDSSVEEKEALIQQCDGEIAIVQAILANAVSIATELEMIEVDSILQEEH
ncbi:GTPase SAR1 family protein [Paenibacillus amylolyticus]|uniref:GTPase SAR1 family protein n=1 Tax=Paenibacillus amylolyticus TaxID=1451 RepID=A0AAP5H928_PAEAM|nr:dynamin family protein [Paenibacillus amylolyticus]MDR6726181.1 GTPase SAR1 family protein [Paenibacillus amylolyticus]